tara:strand:- start:4188 stop:5378 length:1191 start_codon:yes stop_codon:yes gene_type:complete
MGGAQKSMLHPYDDLDLTFRELIGFAKMFSKGGKFREKVDGCNLTWRFDGDEFYLARNWGHFRDGGITMTSYREYLTGHPAEAQFTRALDRLAKLRGIMGCIGFHKDYGDEVWINMEVIDKLDPQMLRYDHDCFVIHNLCRFVDGKKPYVQNVLIKEISLAKMAEILCVSGIRVLHAPHVETDRMHPTHYRKFQEFMMSIMSQSKLGLDDTLRDYVQRSVIEALQCETPIDFDDALKLSENVSGKGKHNIKQIREKYDEESQRCINELCLSSNRIKATNRIMMCIKHAWLDFGANCLEGVCSSLIDDPIRARDRIDDMIDFNAEVVDKHRLSKPNVYHGFMRQLETFVSFDVEAQIIEGFVFESEGTRYKLTGAFQSLNNICGTARYQLGELFPEE